MTVIALLALGLLLYALPVVTFLKVLRLSRDLDALRRQLTRTMPPPREEPAAARPATPASGPLAQGDWSETSDPEQIERQIGERVLLYAGMIVLVLGVAFFLRYAFERQWMSPLVRVLVGLVSGAALVGGGQRLARSGYRQYGLFLCGGGAAVLFLSVYAAFALYELIGRASAFALLAIVASGTALLADREASLPLALMGVCGGFATPFLVGGERDVQVALFAYVALLIGATMYLSRRRGWPWLNLASLVCTIATVMAWAAAYYAPGRYLVTEAFITLYCAMFLVILRENGHSTLPGARQVSILLAGAPVSYHLASLAILASHGTAFLLYTAAAGGAVAVAGRRPHASALRCAGWAAVAVPLLIWAPVHPGERIAGVIAAALAVWLLLLLLQAALVRSGAVLDAWDTALLHANGIWMYAALHESLAPVAGPWRQALVALLAGAANTGVWAALRSSGPAALHWLGVGATLGAIAAAVALSGPWVVVMWAMEGAAIVWVSVRLEREWLRRAGLALVAVSIVRWLLPDIQGTAPGFSVLLNARALTGLLTIGLLYGVSWMLDRRRAGAAGRTIAERAIVLVGASALTVYLVSAEITSYWALQSQRGDDARLAGSLMLSASWAAYAGLLVAVGMRRHYRPIRYFAIALFGLTLLKVFLVDFQQLGGLYRVAGFVVVGAILLLVSFLYQRTRTAESGTS